MPKKEKIIPPSKAVDKLASRGLQQGKRPDARVMADASVAKRQGAKRPKGK